MIMSYASFVPSSAGPSQIGTEEDPAIAQCHVSGSLRRINNQTSRAVKELNCRNIIYFGHPTISQVMSAAKFEPILHLNELNRLF
jgi:hypothetical protein